MTLLPIIEYVDFWDVPRQFLVEYVDDLYLFDCPFDEDVEDYPDRYVVYRLPRDLKDRLETMTWTELPAVGQVVGETPVAGVRFDPTHRRYVDSQCFSALGLGSPPRLNG
jgi:hypothetical protein